MRVHAAACAGCMRLHAEGGDTVTATNLQVRTTAALADRFRGEAKRRRLSYGALLALLLDGVHAGGMPEHAGEHAGPPLAPRVAELERLVAELLARVDGLDADDKPRRPRSTPPPTPTAGSLALRAWADAEGLSARGLARRLDAPPGTVGAWLTGRRPPPLDARERLAAVAGVPVDAWG